MITAAKRDSVAGRRLALIVEIDDRDQAVQRTGPRYQDRPGGYMRILKCGFRTGDAAPMAIVELVDRETDLEAEE